MTIHMSIRISVLMVVLIAGDGQLFNSSTFYRIPTFQIFNTSHLPFYSCKFDVKVDCLWKVDGKAIRIIPNNYTWMIGDGYNTHVCSIKGKSMNVPKLNRNNLNVTCHGILFGSRNKIVEIGDSIQLDCYFNKTSKCSWTRNDSVINIDGRYKYIHHHDGSNARNCSIQIQEIQTIDLTTWTCLAPATDDKDQQHLTSFYNLQLNNTADRTSTRSTADTDSSTTKTSPEYLTPSDKALLPNETDTSATPSDGFLASQPIQFFLGFIGIILLIATTIGFVQLIRKLKKKHTKHNDDESRDHDEEIDRDRLLLETIVPTSPSTSDQPHAYYNVTTITTQSQAEDANGYLVPLKVTRNANSNETKAKISKQSKDINDPKNHIYEKVDDRARSEPQ